MAEGRYCVECGSERRMVGRPEGVTLCPVCAGEQPHPNATAEEQRIAIAQSRFRMMKGFYNSSEAVGPGQGRVR